MPSHRWQKQYDDGRLFVYTEVNDHSGELTVSVHDGPDVNDPELVHWYSPDSEQMIEDGYFHGSVGSARFNRSVAEYMDHISFRRPKMTRGR